MPAFKSLLQLLLLLLLLLLRQRLLLLPLRLLLLLPLQVLLRLLLLRLLPLPPHKYEDPADLTQNYITEIRLYMPKKHSAVCRQDHGKPSFEARKSEWKFQPWGVEV